MEAFNSEMFSFFSAALPKNTFYVAQFEGTEALNTLFNFELKLLCEDADIDTEALIETKAVFTIHRKKGDDAVFPGYISKITECGSIRGYTYYNVLLQPTFARFKPLVNNAVFLDSDLKQTIEQVISRESFFPLDYEFRLTGKYPKKEFAMQYGESSFDHILRRLEEQGAYFYFEKNSERVIFADNPMSHTQSEGTVYYSPITGLENSVIDEVITTLTLDQAMLPARVVVRTYHWQDPNNMLTGIAEVSPKGTGDVCLCNEEAESQIEAERIAKIRAEQILAAARIFTGSGYVPFFRPGTVFTLAMHPTEEFNRDYIVTKIKHEGRQETLLTMVLGIPIDSEAEHFFYKNSFECIESNIKYVSSGTVNLTVIPGAIRAFIDGDQAGEPLMDKYGRYRILFPFDVSGRSMGKASCWVRRAQEQVGKDFGAAFPLVPGTEVLVSFINGNPDWPIIKGALANGESGSITTGANSHLWAIRTEGGPQMTFNNKNNGIQLSNLTGSEVAMGSGATTFIRGRTHIGLKTTAASFSDIGGFLADNMTGFVYRRRAICYSLSQYLSTAAVGAGRAGQKIYEGLSEKSADPSEPQQDWGATLAKFIPLIAFLAPPPYNIRISASKKNSSVRMQCFPNAKEMFINIGLLILSRGISIATESVDGAKNPNLGPVDIDITDYTETLKKSMQAVYNAGVIVGYEKYKGKTKNNLQQEVMGGEIFEKAVLTPCGYYTEVQKAMEDSIRTFEMYIEDAASEENRIVWTESLNALKKLASELAYSYEESCIGKKIKQKEGVNENTKAAIKRNKFIVQTLGLLPELGIMVALLIWQLRITGQKIGGIMIDAKDKNMNIHAKSYIGVHAERGIYLNTREAKYDREKPLSKGNIGLWGAPSNRATDRNKADKDISKIFKTIKNEPTWKKAPNVLNNRLMTVEEVIDEGHANLSQPVTGGAAIAPGKKENTFIAEETDFSYMSSQYSITWTSTNYVTRARQIEFRSPTKSSMCFDMSDEGVVINMRGYEGVINDPLKINFFTMDNNDQCKTTMYLCDNTFYYGFYNIIHGIHGEKDIMVMRQSLNGIKSGLQFFEEQSLLTIGCEYDPTSSIILDPVKAQIKANTVVLGNIAITNNEISHAKGGVLQIGDNVIKVTEFKKLEVAQEEVEIEEISEISKLKEENEKLKKRLEELQKNKKKTEDRKKAFEEQESKRAKEEETAKKELKKTEEKLASHRKRLTAVLEKELRLKQEAIEAEKKWQREKIEELLKRADNISERYKVLIEKKKSKMERLEAMFNKSNYLINSMEDDLSDKVEDPSDKVVELSTKPEDLTPGK